MKKYILISSILANVLMTNLGEATSNNQASNVEFDAVIKDGTPEMSELKKIIANSFKVVTDMKAADEDYEQYFSRGYIQHVDGKTLDYNGFIDHMKAIKKTLKSLKIVFHDMIGEGGKVATRHTAYVVKNDNKEVEIQVITIFEMSDGKIVSCNELTYMQKGERADRDIGSRK